MFTAQVKSCFVAHAKALLEIIFISISIFEFFSV